MKLMDLLTENQDEPRVKYYGVPENYSGTPEDHRMIRRMKHIYKFLIKGRGKVRMNMEPYPKLDVSYVLPPLNEVAFLITYPSKRSMRQGDVVEYMIDVAGKAKYTFHNLETQRETSVDRLMSHRSYDISFVYKNKFDKYRISITA